MGVILNCANNLHQNQSKTILIILRIREILHDRTAGATDSTPPSLPCGIALSKITILKIALSKLCK